MSEELLKALMQLFAIIAKQNEGPSVKENEFVQNFLSQLDHSTSEKYIQLYNEYAIKKNTEKRVSMMDSVNTIGIAKKINKILTQKQKIVVLIRLFELIKADTSGFDIKYPIIKTLADIFNISPFDFSLIEVFVLEQSIEKVEKSELLIIGPDSKAIRVLHSNIGLPNAEGEKGFVFILRIQSVSLFLLKAILPPKLYLTALLKLSFQSSASSTPLLLKVAAFVV